MLLSVPSTLNVGRVTRCARPRSARRRMAPAASSRPCMRPGVVCRYTSATGRQGEGGEEEKTLRNEMADRAQQQQQGQGQPKAVDETKQSGYHHESRQDLERKGAVVHEDTHVHVHPIERTSASHSGGGGASTASAPESGTEGRGAESGGSAQGSAKDTEDMGSAPESGTRT